jgi:iron complex outermembrane receptor protein
MIIVPALLTANFNASSQVLRDTLTGVTKKAQARDSMHKASYLNHGIKELALSGQVLNAYKNEPISRLLAQQLPVFVRSYGVNGPANLTLRGASAAQTSVRWNGVPLQNGATGLVDLLLIPVGVVDQVSVSYGSTAGINGSGTVGGLLNLTNEGPAFSERLQYVPTLSGAAGSFGNYRASFKLKGKSKRWVGGVGGYYARAENNFRYTDLSGNQVQLTNSYFSSLNIQGNLARRLNARSTLEAIVWLGKNEREIPPALFESASVKEQRDAYVRSLVSFKHAFSSKVALGIPVSVMDEWFRYRDTAAGLNTQIHTRQWYTAPRLSFTLHPAWQLPELVLSISAPLQWNYFPGTKGRDINRGALAAQLEGSSGNGSFNANGRAEVINGRLYGAGGLNGSCKPAGLLTLRASVGYTYRAPTLNELYYVPGGNEGLLPEQGFNAEAGYTWEYASARTGLRISHSATGFYRNINNWILWFGGAVWTPHNIARVVSTGIETENKITWKRNKISWELALNGAFISSRTRESKVAGDGSIGKQIPYAPQLLGQGSISLYGANWRLSYLHTYTGIRYYNVDESGMLKDYKLGNLLAGYTLHRRYWAIELNVHVNNLLNERYLEVSGRPSPGANWLLGLTLSSKN